MNPNQHHTSFLI